MPPCVASASFAASTAASMRALASAATVTGAAAGAATAMGMAAGAAVPHYGRNDFVCGMRRHNLAAVTR